MSLTVLVAPLHAPSVREHPRGLLPQVRKIDADIALPSEAYPLPLRHELAHAHDYRYVMSDGGKDPVRGQYDVPILVRRGLRSIGSGQVFGCNASVPKRIAPERWMTYAVQDVGGHRICAINLHPHAAVQAADGSFNHTDRARGFKNQMRRFDELLTFAESMNWKLLVGGDLNFADQGKEPLSPYAILRAHGLEVHSHNIIALAWAPALDLKVTTVTPAPGITDHIWLVGKAR